MNHWSWGRPLPRCSGSRSRVKEDLPGYQHQTPRSWWHTLSWPAQIRGGAGSLVGEGQGDWGQVQDVPRHHGRPEGRDRRHGEKAGCDSNFEQVPAKDELRDFQSHWSQEVPVSAGAAHVERASEEVAEAPEVLFAPEAAPVEAAPVQEVTVVSEEVAGTEPEVKETNEVSTLVEAHLQYLCWKLICWRTNKHWFVQTNKHCTPYLVSSNWTVALVCLNSSLNNLFSERGEFFLF